MKRGLTDKGLRQAEVEFYLWGGCSLFPFMQIITDMQTGGAAFYKTGSSPSGAQISILPLLLLKPCGLSVERICVQYQCM